MAVSRAPHGSQRRQPSLQKSRTRFESNLQAAFLSAERPDEDVLVVIHDDCPIHQIVRAPMDDAIGKDPPRS